MRPIVGAEYRININGRMARVQIRSRLEVAEHVCGNLWKKPRTWWLAKTTDTNRTVTIKRATRLKPIKRERTLA